MTMKRELVAGKGMIEWYVYLTALHCHWITDQQSSSPMFRTPVLNSTRLPMMYVDVLLGKVSMSQDYM